MNAIHLLYSPTMACNLSCNYCYLGKQTTEASLKKDSEFATKTLKDALEKLDSENILAFNVSLHGGEVTTLQPKILENMFDLINKYYLNNFDKINSLGHKKTAPHIKTNLYKFSPLYELFDKYKVSISASIDLPLSLHGKHRLTLNGKSWLDKTIDNLKLLAKYPHNKKISATLSKEHFENIDQFIKDIWFIHKEIGFDMNNFNIMFAFPSDLNDEKKGNLVLTPLTEEEQLVIYNRLNKEFKGTELEDGLLRNWFDEFKPSYCTNSMNCGEKFFLLQGDGNVYSCVRGQGLKEFHYGNIYENTFDEIIKNGSLKVKTIHSEYGLNSDCNSCDSLSICNTGCPVVKLNTKKSKSYSCNLQKQMYKDFPYSFKTLDNEKKEGYKIYYLQQIHPNLAINEKILSEKPNILLSKDFFDEKNALINLIKDDENLKNIFSPETFLIELGSKKFYLESQLLKQKSVAYVIDENDVFKVHFPKEIMNSACEELIRNTFYMQMLRDTHVIYGDEKRTKQEHLFTYQIFNNLLTQSSLSENSYEFDLMPLMLLNKHMFKKGVLNNMFFTTSSLRDYHYNKHKNNAFYHLQTVNLPFQNIEFYFLRKDFYECA